jgi:hypothetical protein
MTELGSVLARLRSDLLSLRIQWALVGGVAVSIQSEPRTTLDLDIAVAVGKDEEAERIAFALKSRGYREQAVLEQREVARLATVRLLAPGGEGSAVGVDLLFASSGVESEIIAAAEVLEVLPGLYIPTAARGHLIALKVLAGRDKDRADARTLLAYSEPVDLQLARETLVLIQERGFHRGKNLLVELARLQEPEG